MIVKTTLAEQAEQFELEGVHYVGRRVLAGVTTGDANIESFFDFDSGHKSYAKRMILFQLDYDRGQVFVDPAILKPYQRPERVEASERRCDVSLKVELPQGLIEKFERSSFCPNDLIRGRLESGVAWNTLETEYDPGGDARYSTTAMFYALHHNGQVKRAERPWGEMTGKDDGEFLRSVVEWFQSMTQAKPCERPEGAVT